MPQMSPMLWMYLYLYFIILMVIVSSMIFNIYLIPMSNNLKSKSNFLKIYFKKKW